MDDFGDGALYYYVGEKRWVMVALAIALGIYAYLILALGLAGWLSRLPVFLISLPFLIGGVIWLRRNLRFAYSRWIKEARKDWLVLFVLGLLGIQIVINFLGAISPELSFDALWYHLTAAKLYVQNQQIFYIPGWLLWPANVPRLADMFYIVALLFSDEILAKLINFAFGILSAVALFNLLKRYLSLKISLLGVVTFYTMLVVGWQSTTAYVDLVRTFFEILALDLFLQWVETKKENFLWEGAILAGLAISTKILAFGSLFTFLILLFLLRRRKGWTKLILIFSGLALLIVSPWLVFSLIHTGNPLFPLLGSFNQNFSPGISPEANWLWSRITRFPFLLWQATLNPDDIISPVYLIFLPLVLIFIWKQNLSIKITALFVLLGFFFAPRESNRYLLPYLGGLTLVTFSILQTLWLQEKKWERFLLCVVIFGALLNLGSRILATRKFVPYLSGRESKSEFLSKNLNFSYGDFYDVDGFLGRNIKKDDLVLIFGIHNLYYVDFPYVHESWAKQGTYFTHILVGNNQNLPEKFGQAKLIYQNKKTAVRLYLFADQYK